MDSDNVRAVPDSSRVVFWDFDGTLARRDGLWSGALLDAWRQVQPSTMVTADLLRPYLRSGFPWHAPDVVRAPLSPEQWWASLRPVIMGAYVRAGLDTDHAASATACVPAEFYRTDAWTVIQGATEALRVTSDAGYRNVILSNHPPELPALVDALGLGLLVDRTITSAAVGAEKPHRAIFEYAMTKTRVTVDDHVWMVGDNPISDVKGARDAGIRAILADGDYPDSTRATVLAAAHTIAASPGSFVR
jgi:putative hydrolase of the HAD superfamily